MVKETIDLEFKGRIRTLRFGIGPTRILCEDLNITLGEVQNLDTNELIQDLIVSALKFECFVNNIRIDFNKWEVYQWITDMEQTTFQEIFDIFIHTRVVGKSIYDQYIKNLDELNPPTPEAEKKNNPGTI